jgi:hypothetical protein
MYVILIWIVCAVIGHYYGASKGHAVLGTLLGLFLGVFGLAILLFVPATEASKIAKAEDKLRIDQAARGRIEQYNEHNAHNAHKA